MTWYLYKLEFHYNKQFQFQISIILIHFNISITVVTHGNRNSVEAARQREEIKECLTIVKQGFFHYQETTVKNKTQINCRVVLGGH